MASKMGPVIRQILEAAQNAARHADELPGRIRMQRTKLQDFRSHIRGQDHFDGGSIGTPSSFGPKKPSPGGGTDERIPRPDCLDENGEIDWSQAPHDGFRLGEDGNPILRDHQPQAGERFDRFGHPYGTFVSPLGPDGPYSWDSRSLPYHENPNAYHLYEWDRPLSELHDAYAKADPETRQRVDIYLDDNELELSDTVQRGNAAPAFNQGGGAEQDILPLPPKLLEDLGMISEV